MLLVKLNQKRELVAFVQIKSLERGSEGMPSGIAKQDYGGRVLLGSPLGQCDASAPNTSCVNCNFIRVQAYLSMPGRALVGRLYR